MTAGTMTRLMCASRRICEDCEACGQLVETTGKGDYTHQLAMTPNQPATVLVVTAVMINVGPMAVAGCDARCPAHYVLLHRVTLPLLHYEACGTT